MFALLGIAVATTLMSCGSNSETAPIVAAAIVITVPSGSIPIAGTMQFVATVTDADAMSAALGGLGYAGEFVIVGIPAKPIQAEVPAMVLQRKSIHGWPSGTSIDSEDTLKFSEITGVLPLIEKYPLERAAEAYERMMSGKARFRVVLETGA